MIRLIPALSCLLIALSAFADEVKDAPPPAQTDVVGIVIFFGLFILLCVGFFGYMWWKHKNGKEE
ncbi:MAG: hypothetical protein JWN94_1096 [Betaproteobacteria bacterium]|nr:hypothetical protein [Betaproteobacteria bacterium]